MSDQPATVAPRGKAWLGWAAIADVPDRGMGSALARSNDGFSDARPPARVACAAVWPSFP